VINPTVESRKGWETRKNDCVGSMSKGMINERIIKLAEAIYIYVNDESFSSIPDWCDELTNLTQLVISDLIVPIAEKRGANGEEVVHGKTQKELSKRR